MTSHESDPVITQETIDAGVFILTDIEGTLARLLEVATPNGHTKPQDAPEQPISHE